MDQRVVAFVNALQPAELALRDFVRPRLTPAIVQRIAELDYGMQVDEYKLAIEELLAAKRLPQELRWPPRAVLELASYGDPEARKGSSALTGRPGHLARLFACLVLIRADDALQPAKILAALVESAVALGPEATGDAVRYLAWCRLNEPGSWRDDPEARPFLTLGLLLAYLMSPLAKDPQTVSGLTAAVVSEVEAAMAERNPWWADQPSAAVIKQMGGGGEGYRIWRGLVSRCPDVDAIEPLRAWFPSGGVS